MRLPIVLQRGTISLLEASKSNATLWTWSLLSYKTRSTEYKIVQAVLRRINSRKTDAKGYYDINGSISNEFTSL
jgi:hypothetical protein